MSSAAGRLFAASVAGSTLIVAGRKYADRRRRLRLMPIGMSKAAGITERTCRQQATLRARAAMHPAVPPILPATVVVDREPR